MGTSSGHCGGALKTGRKGIVPVLLKLIAVIIALRMIHKQKKGIGQSSEAGIRLSFLTFQVGTGQKAAYQW